MVLTREETALFASFDDGLRTAFWHGLSFDQAIRTMRDKITLLERCRDNDLDPKRY